MSASASSASDIGSVLVDGPSGPEACLLIGRATAEASWIISDAGTASITAAFTMPSSRGRGLAASLLSAAIAWAREAGYVRCAVDWESANIEANRFWLDHFEAVVTGFRRTVDVP